MQGSWHARAWHVFSAADLQLRAETLAGYRYQIMLDPAAIAWGLSCALLLALLVESLLVMLGSLLMGRRRRTLYR
ncbi:hypothetical protein D3C77_773090 [compost metagenome]